MDEISITFKAGGGYDAPWVVFKAPSGREVIADVQEFAKSGGFQIVKAAAREFQAVVPANAAQAVRNVVTAIPGSQEQKLPDSVTPTCSNCMAAAQWKEGVSGKGTPYSGWYCQNKTCGEYWKPVK